MMSTIMAIHLILIAQLNEGCRVGCRSNFGMETGRYDRKTKDCLCSFHARYDDTTGIYRTEMQPPSKTSVHQEDDRPTMSYDN
jgi:hypothetical protein